MIIMKVAKVNKKHVKTTSEQARIGALSQPCFFIGSGFKEIIWWAWNEFDKDFLFVTELGPKTLCLIGTSSWFDFPCWSPSYLSPSDSPEKGRIFWRWEWGIGLIAAKFNFRLSLPISSTPRPLVIGFILEHGSDLFRLGAGGISQLGCPEKTRSLGQFSFCCLVQKKSRRSASSLLKDATGNPWMLATPNVTRLRYDTFGASCLRTCEQIPKSH